MIGRDACENAWYNPLSWQGAAVSVTVQFENPPVVETAIGVQFPELPEFRAGHFGLYWETIKERFKRIEDKPRLPEVMESFPRRLPLGEMEFRVSQAVGAQRAWYVADDETQLIQLQPNRFLFNWRGRSGQKYPSYDGNSEVFLREFEAFRLFCERQGMEQPVPQLCEVTYVNHIVPEAGESAIELFGRVLCGLRWESVDGWLPAPESVSFNRVYVIANNRGRLYAEAAIGVRLREKQEFVQLHLTARVNCNSGGRSDFVESLRLAHDWIVNGFVSMTDFGIQKSRWRRIA